MHEQQEKAVECFACLKSEHNRRGSGVHVIRHQLAGNTALRRLGNPYAISVAVIISTESGDYISTDEVNKYLPIVSVEMDWHTG